MELPKSLPFILMETAIVLRLKVFIVFIIYERISRPLVVPVSLEVVQLLTMYNMKIWDITYLRRGTFIRPTRIKVSIFPHMLIITVLIGKILFKHIASVYIINHTNIIDVLPNIFKILDIPFIIVFSLNSQWIL